MADNNRKDPAEREYIGNIWGWKFSLFSLGLILFLGGIMLYRHISLGVPFGGPPLEATQETPADSTTTPTTETYSTPK